MHTEIERLEAETKGKTRRSLVARLMQLGLSKEVAYRLGELWSYTRRAGERVLKIGRILLAKIVDFIEKHPYAAAGAALGAAVTVLVHSIPWIGPALARVAASVAIPLFTLVGASIDAATKDGRPYRGVLPELVQLAHDFFRALIECFKTLFPTAA